MLHITNGDSAAGSLRLSGTPGTVVSWRDVLHEGPIPAGLSPGELREVRARFIADAGWDSYAHVLSEFEERDRQVAGFREHEEVVLWFEHDLYDQLQLLQILDWFAGQTLGQTALSLICTDSFPGVSPFHGLGQLTPAQIGSLFPSRKRVTSDQLELARAGWNAIRSPDPTGIELIINGDTRALPYLGAALRRFLEEYPGQRDGLSRTERQVVELLGAGTSTPTDLFLATADREEHPFMGDSTLWNCLHGLASGPVPLLSPVDGGSLDLPGPGENLRHFVKRPLALTDAGDQVAAGNADYVALNGIDRWLGGVHLLGRSVEWRWDAGGGHAGLRHSA
jgi:hypothetical protein